MFVRPFVALTASVLMLSEAMPAQAAFPAGTNGRIVYARFADGNYDLFSVRPSGERRRRLTRTARFETDPAVSPNSRWVAFTRSDGHDLEIFKLRIDGPGPRDRSGDPVQLTDNDVDDSDPTWSPSLTNGHIAYVRRPVSDGVTKPADLYVMTDDGRKHTRITRTKKNELAPSWGFSNPRGRIAYCRGSLDGPTQIHTIRRDGSKHRRLTGSDAYNCDPNWSPDARSITFYSDRDGDGEIFRMTRKGESEQKVTDNAVEDQAPVWSPDGRWIAYSRFVDGDFGLRRVHPNGSDGQRVIDGAGSEQFPDWSRP